MTESKTTSETARENQSGYGSNEESLAAIERTLKETADPSNTDLRTLVANGIRTYWQKQYSHADALAKAENETVKAARDLAARIGNPPREFLDDQIAAIAPPLLLLGVYRALPKIVGPRLSEHPRGFAVALTITLLVCAGIAGGLTRRLRISWVTSEFARHSLGALAAGIVIAVVSLGYVSLQIKDKRDVAVRLTEQRLQELALLSLQHQQRTGTFLESAHFGKGEFQTATMEISGNSAVYETESQRLPGVFVTKVDPSGGQIVWKYADREDVVATILIGRVEQLSGDRFLLIAPDGTTKQVYFEAGVPEPTNKTLVAVALNPKTDSATMIAPIK